MEKSSRKKKSEHSDEKHKRKKNKKHKKHPRSSSDSDEWVEAPSKVQSVQRDEWMTQQIPSEANNNTESSFLQNEDEWIPTVSREDMIHVSSHQRRKEAEIERKKQEDEIWKQRELNPYWKKNGSGVPDDEPVKEDARLPSVSVGDGGLRLLQKAHERILEQAAQGGKSKEEIAAERYGSYENLLSMISEAQSRKRNSLKSKYPDEERSRDWRNQRKHRRPPSRSSSESPERSYRFQKPKDYKKDRRSTNEFSSKQSRDKYKHRYNDDRKEHTKNEKSLQNVERANNEKSRSRYQEKGDSLAWERDGEFSKYSQRDSKPSWKKSDRDLPVHLDKNVLPAWKKNIEFTRNDDVKMSVNEQVHKSSSSSDEDGHAAGSSSLMASKPRSDSPVEEEDENEAAAKMFKNKLLGNMCKDEKKPRKDKKKDAEHVMLAKMDSCGQMRPIIHTGDEQGFTSQHSRKALKKFVDDGSSYSLKNMFQREKLTTAADNLEMFMEVAAQCDDRFDDNETSGISKRAMSKMGNRVQEDKDYSKAIQQHQKQNAALEKCELCLENANAKRHLIITIKDQAYLSIPGYQSLAEGHCLIIPKRHVKSFLSLEEDEWIAVETIKQSLRMMFRQSQKNVIFLETSMNFHKFMHAVVECIPVPEDDGNMAPMYFKKAIEESEAEWAHNIKLISLKKGLRHSVPKNFPYFCVQFDPEVHSGFAHVIEDERSFPRNFGKEVLGGMLDIDYNMLYKNKKDDPIKKSNEALEFSKVWKSFEHNTETA